jgi:hypothetical protein
MRRISPMLELIASPSTAMQQLFSRLRKKYMDEANPAANGIQYAPMDILLR